MFRFRLQRDSRPSIKVHLSLSSYLKYSEATITTRRSATHAEWFHARLPKRGEVAHAPWCSPKRQASSEPLWYATGNRSRGEQKSRLPEVEGSRPARALRRYLRGGQHPASSPAHASPGY